MELYQTNSDGSMKTSTQKVLEQVITTHNKSYREGNPTISDEGYDRLVDTLSKTFPKSDLLKKSVIEEKPTSRKVKLPIPMYSLEKKKSIEEIKDWVKSLNIKDNETFVITPKFDGCSICVEGSNAYTRGDGEVGQDCCEHFSKMQNTSFEDENVVYFGEAIISKTTFETKYKGKYKSARNLVAGLLNRSEAGEELKDVDFVRYGGDQKIDKIVQLGINVPYFYFHLQSFDEEISVENLDKFYQKWSEIYQIDGLVIDVNSSEERERLGRLPNNNPKYAIAYKNPKWSGSHVSTVTSVEVNISKQGKLKPVILIEPVDIDGITVERVTGYNMKYMIDNNIAEGSEIEITRSGDVIPKHLTTLIYKTEQVEHLIDSLTECPCCGELTKWDETMTELICLNPNCEDKLISKMEHFFITIGVEEFSRPSIASLYDIGYKSIELILKAKKEDLIEIDGWAETSAENLLKQFRKLKEEGVPFAKLLHALDLFEGVLGEKTAQLIIDNSGEEDVNFPNLTDLCKIKGVAETTANAFIKGIDSFVRKEPFPVKISQIKSPKQEVKGDKYKGMKVCFTGCRDKELEQLITEQGGEIVSGVSKTTTHLIVKDLTPDTLKSSKSVKAKELGIEIIDIETFKKN